MSWAPPLDVRGFSTLSGLVAGGKFDIVADNAAGSRPGDAIDHASFNRACHPGALNAIVFTVDNGTGLSGSDRGSRCRGLAADCTQFGEKTLKRAEAASPFRWFGDSRSVLPDANPNRPCRSLC